MLCFQVKVKKKGITNFRNAGTCRAYAIINIQRKVLSIISSSLISVHVTCILRQAKENSFFMLYSKYGGDKFELFAMYVHMCSIISDIILANGLGKILISFI